MNLVKLKLDLQTTLMLPSIGKLTQLVDQTSRSTNVVVVGLATRGENLLLKDCCRREQHHFPIVFNRLNKLLVSNSATAVGDGISLIRKDLIVFVCGWQM